MVGALGLNAILWCLQKQCRGYVPIQVALTGDIGGKRFRWRELGGMCQAEPDKKHQKDSGKNEKSGRSKVRGIHRGECGCIRHVISSFFWMDVYFDAQMCSGDGEVVQLCRVYFADSVQIRMNV